jgi:hypothetical protein
MPHQARTYGSRIHESDPQNAWRFPTGPELDKFGVPIGNQNFGLEEFNFNPILLDYKLAYVPCFGSSRNYPRPHVSELRLIYRIINNANYNYIHYATLHNVKSLLNADIPNIRQLIEPHYNEIYLREECQVFFSNNYPEFEKRIIEMQNSNLIADNENNNSFLVNVEYESISILEKPTPCRMNSHFASNCYINVKY